MSRFEPLAIDGEGEAERISQILRDQITVDLRRRGAVVGVSGGVDSAVCLALAVRALGPERVVALLMPERDSSDDSLRLGRMVASRFGATTCIEPVGGTLEAVGCYARQTEAIRSVFPEYSEGWRCKLVLPPLEAGPRLNVFRLVVADPDGQERSARLPAESYRQLVAATNFKQRIRKMVEYYHADRLGYAVVGSPNRLEYALGFFVKKGTAPRT